MSHQARIILPRPSDASPNPPSEPPPRASHKKRSVVATACHSCRQRRSKCDGNSPCTPCQSKGTKCQYDGPPGLTRAAAQRERMGRMETDNATMLEILWFMQNKSEEDAQDLLAYIRSQHNGDFGAMTRWLKGKRQGITTGSLEKTSPDGISDPSLTGRSANDMMDSENEEFGTARQQNYGSSAASSSMAPRIGDPGSIWRHHATVATVQRAVQMFFDCTGLLFHVYAEEHVKNILEQTLGSVTSPESTMFLDVLKKHPHMKIKFAEISGMASVGILYLRATDDAESPPPGLAQHFYDITRWLLDNAIECDPFRAMKICVLLTMYNIVLKATVALVYIELGLGLGRNNGLNSSEPLPNFTAEEWIDCQRTWRTLLLFSGWLGATLGYVPTHIDQPSQLPPSEVDNRREYVVQTEMVKITILKAKIIRTIHDDSVVDDNVIAGFRGELRIIHNDLPDWMSMKVLTEEKSRYPLRRVVMYVHLFYLSAMQLLHRRVMKDTTIHEIPARGNRESARQAVIEGVMAAKMAAKFLGLMTSEGSIVKICWLCIFSAYTTAIIILQATVQKVIFGYGREWWTADLSLVATCIDALNFCATIDTMASQFRDLLSFFMDIIQESVDGQIEVDSKANTNDDNGEYIFEIKEGNSSLHKLSRDLLRLIRQPFERNLEVVPEGELLLPSLRHTLVNCIEAAMGTPLEWSRELQTYREELQEQESVVDDTDMSGIELVSTLSPGRFVDSGDGEIISAWSAWAPPPF